MEIFTSTKTTADPGLILSGTSHDTRECLWMLRITKSCIPMPLIFVKFYKCAKYYFKIRELLVVVLFCTVRNKDAHTNIAKLKVKI